MTILSAERLRELDTVLGPEQRNQLLSALATQAAEARGTLRGHRNGGDDRVLRRDVHRLKGAAQIVGADDLIEALRAIEQCQPGGVSEKLFDAADAQLSALIDATSLLGAR
ncbi:Hpt domain-containing protein [Sphingomonas bacterium]|uniref:Hpt domain-containing protein n=1 Tax=Sphingomonas bacterium TaxID=1895847 RepID=UPI002618AD32|nr:Hpt domain-containing protein [Sphingomonas bacterium]MDB5678499.1 hypothetical protein [Sphingomonas bacterium]